MNDEGRPPHRPTTITPGHGHITIHATNGTVSVPLDPLDPSIAEILNSDASNPEAALALLSICFTRRPNPGAQP